MSAAATIVTKGLREHWHRAVRTVIIAAQEPRRRTLLEFAEQEIVVAGRYAGQFRADRQPFARLFFNAVNSGLWTSFNFVASVQIGKTTIAFIIPLLYHLFELAETVICGVPDMDLASEKWAKIIRPAIEQTRYQKYLPTFGEGSREGSRVRVVRFTNGADLRFMPAGGGAAALSSHTTRVLIITETDKMDEMPLDSEETGKIEQMIGRTKSYDELARVYSECTPTIQTKRTWKSHVGGSQSKICLQCAYCEKWVIPTDTATDCELLTGWKDSPDEITASEKGTFACSHCGHAWSETDRRDSNIGAVLIHGGQSIELLDDAEQAGRTDIAPIRDSGWAIVGPLPRTRRFSMRASAVNNLLRTAGNMAAEEWSYVRDENEESAKRARLNHLWALPHEPSITEVTPLETTKVQRRTRKLPRGLVPAGATCLSIGLDVGKWMGHYVVIAWTPATTLDIPKPLTPHYGHIVEHGCIDIVPENAEQKESVQRATLLALREFRDRCHTGWAKEEGGKMSPQQVWIDCNWIDSKSAVLFFCQETKKLFGTQVFRPLIGKGEGAETRGRYEQPKKIDKNVHFIGEEYYIAWNATELIFIVGVNVDYWKSWVHDRLAMSVQAAGAMTLFDAPPVEHLSFVKHLTAEVRVQKLVEKRGLVTVWERKRKQNHWLDASVYAAAAGHFSIATVARLMVPANQPPVRSESQEVTTWDGRPLMLR